MPEANSKPEAALVMRPVKDADYNIQVDTTVVAKGPVRMTVKNNQPVAGSDPANPRYANFKVHCQPPKRAKQQRVRVRYSDPEINAAGSSGSWMYLSGSAPAANTPRVRARGQGTIMVVESANDVDRVYLLSGAGSSIEIFAPPDAANPSVVITTQNDYVEIDDAGNVVNPPGVYTDDEARKEFIEGEVLPLIEDL